MRLCQGTIAAGVKKLLTVEYQEIHSQHHQIKTLTPRGLAETWLNGNLPEFDFAVSFSSYEHDGLGRYGDPVDPWGDIWDVRRISCFVKPGGLLYLGVPMGPDQVYFDRAELLHRLQSAMLKRTSLTA